MLQVTNVSDFRKNLKKYIDGVAGTHNTLIVNSNGKTVVVMALEEYNKMDETDYLLSTEANKAMMYESMEQIKRGELVNIDLEDLIKNLENDQL
jgi:antitoxin YefM